MIVFSVADANDVPRTLVWLSSSGFDACTMPATDHVPDGADSLVHLAKRGRVVWVDGQCDDQNLGTRMSAAIASGLKVTDVEVGFGV